MDITGKIVISSRVRIAVLLRTETTQKIYRGAAAEVDFFSRWRYCNKNYGYPSSIAMRGKIEALAKLNC